MPFRARKFGLTFVLALVCAAIALYFSTRRELHFSRELRRYPEPGGEHVIVVYKLPRWFAMPGSGGDAPGLVQLLDGRGKVLESTEVDMVQNVEEPEWSRDHVSIKLIADWSLTRLAPTGREP